MLQLHSSDSQNIQDLVLLRELLIFPEAAVSQLSSYLFLAISLLLVLVPPDSKYSLEFVVFLTSVLKLALFFVRTSRLPWEVYLTGLTPFHSFNYDLSWYR